MAIAKRTFDVEKVKKEIDNGARNWANRNKKFLAQYELFLLVDTLSAKGMESYVSNEPATFYQMAHYLLTKGNISHLIPIVAESASDLDNRARVNRGCEYMWHTIDRERQLGGSQPYIDELSFYMLVLGWYSTIFAFDNTTGLMKTQIWNPIDVYPTYANNQLYTLSHNYPISQEEAMLKSEQLGWNYQPRSLGSGMVKLNDFFFKENNVWNNIVLIDGIDVTGIVPRPEISILTSPIGGSPDKGSLTPSSSDWRSLAGRSIFEANREVTLAFNKWKSMIAQILRDTAQPVTQEFSSTPQATPEQIRERGALFHYAPGEAGLQRLPPAAIPIEIQANMLELRREMQKGSFNDAVYGMMEGQPGYALSMLASSSANQILYPYMDSKHFVLAEADKFWLENLKTSKRVFDVKGKFLEKLKPTDIPEDVTVIVESDVATPKDWLERGSIGGMVREDLDKATLLTEIYKMTDPQGIIRRKSIDDMLQHPVFKTMDMIASANAHADYLERSGDREQALLFRKGAKALESQLGAPAPGQGTVAEQPRIDAQRAAGTPSRVARVSPDIAPPEARGGFTPQQLRRSIGKGTIRTR